MKKERKLLFSLLRAILLFISFVQIYIIDDKNDLSQSISYVTQNKPTTCSNKRKNDRSHLFFFFVLFSFKY